MLRYRIIEDLTSDVMFEAYGKGIRDVYENAALAMFSIICDLSRVRPKKAVDVEVRGKGRREIMLNWLQRLISLVDTEGMFFAKFDILHADNASLKARIWGEGITPGKGGTVVKAVTYHKYMFRKVPDGYKVRATLDI